MADKEEKQDSLHDKMGKISLFQFLLSLLEGTF